MIEPKSGPTYAEGKRGVMHTHSGVLFSLLNPRPEDVRIEDIAWHLSHINRFTGATNAPYSVAEHSVRVFMIARQYTDDPRVWLAALLHDASEAYTGDLSKPMKEALRASSFRIHAVKYSVYDVVEHGVMAAIEKRFDLPIDHATYLIVKRADNEAYIEEAEMYMGTNGVAIPLSPERARDWFMKSYELIQDEIKRRVKVAA